MSVPNIYSESIQNNYIDPYMFSINRYEIMKRLYKDEIMKRLYNDKIIHLTPLIKNNSKKYKSDIVQFSGKENKEKVKIFKITKTYKKSSKCK